ncbi:hypothetical protein J1N35_015087 [Gossypium stocksii]|uniref:Uncharacterized protein n=1 Tax=Gossypium stocksii TaxID=47602 RepID=A0A9D4AAD4_9ROSI|nr:hypothetical protein J1N35_015087 [Gossypium stocksii]
MCSFKSTIRTGSGSAQLERLCTGNLLFIEDIITMTKCFNTIWRALAPIGIGNVTTGKLLRIRPRLWILMVSSWEKSDADINLITLLANTGIISGASITHNSGSDLEETTVYPVKLTKYGPASFYEGHAQEAENQLGAVNVVISSKEEADSGRLGYRRKMMVDHVGPFVMMAITPISPSVSSPSVARKSSQIITHGNSPPLTLLCIPLLPLPLTEEPLDEDDGKLLPGKHEGIAKYD